MNDKPTVIVVGAGASREAGLPLGAELRDRIAGLLDLRFTTIGEGAGQGDRFIYEALTIHATQTGQGGNALNAYLHAAQHIREAMPLAISIDNFLDTHKGNACIELCGKLGIVRSILQAERDSNLVGRPFDLDKLGPGDVNYRQLEKTWYLSFMKWLTEGCSKDDLKARLKSVTLVVFNYDRCIEHFLYQALQTYYGIDGKQAADILHDLRIYHPYGAVGHLPWQEMTGSVEYGAEVDGLGLLALAKEIRTFTEGTDPRVSEIGAIRSRLLHARHVIFLGFAFHKLNMQLLAPEHKPEPGTPFPSYYATAVGQSASNCEAIKRTLKGLCAMPKMIHPNVVIGLECNKLFDEFWMDLSLA